MTFHHKIMAAAVAATLSTTAVHATTVSLELMLLTDTSGSVSSTDFGLMREGYAQAFEDATVQAKIAATSTGSIAVAIGFFDSSYKGLGVSWTEVTAATANAFATTIRGMSRIGSGGTDLVAGLNGAAAEFGTNGFDGTRQVIDLAGDGSQGEGGCSFTQAICVPLQNARDAALAGGVETINALFIKDGSVFGHTGGETIDSIAYGTNNVIGGAGAFVAAATDFSAFSDAIRDKIIREVAPPTIPVPASLPLLLAGLGGLGVMRRKSKKA